VSYLLLKWLHVIGATALLGTGAGIAFFLWRAHRSGDARQIASVAADVVRADLLFTTTAVVLQPVTGYLMMVRAGWPLGLAWIRGSLLLYVLIGACWLPVVWLQWRMRDLAREAAASGKSLPASYFACYRWWRALGWPAFAGVLAVLRLMLAKPT
jgi:uncharacterized membrane protein